MLLCLILIPLFLSQTMEGPLFFYWFYALVYFNYFLKVKKTLLLFSTLNILLDLIMYLPFPVILLVSPSCFLSKGLPLVFLQCLFPGDKFPQYFFVWKVLLLLLKYIFTTYSVLGWHVIYFSILNISLHCIPPPIISTEKLNVSFAIIAPLKQCVFFLSYFKTFLLYILLPTILLWYE